MKVTHYSDKPFELRPIEFKNGDFPNKPDGGLWASPGEAEFGWRQWCQVEKFALDKLKHKVTLDIDTTNFITIDSASDLNKLPWRKLHPAVSLEAIDFEELKKRDVDGILLTDKGEAETRFTHPRTLYGWDCESVLILNERCIKRVSGKRR